MIPVRPPFEYNFRTNDALRTEARITRRPIVWTDFRRSRLQGDPYPDFEFKFNANCRKIRKSTLLAVFRLFLRRPHHHLPNLLYASRWQTPYLAVKSDFPGNIQTFRYYFLASIRESFLSFYTFFGFHTGAFSEPISLGWFYWAYAGTPALPVSRLISTRFSSLIGLRDGS